MLRLHLWNKFINKKCIYKRGIKMFNKIREYIPNAIGSNMNKGVNNVPLSTSIHRIGTIHGNDNAFIKWYFELLK